MAEDGIKVAVRVRILFPEEKRQGLNSIFRCDGGTIWIRDKDGNERDFTYDHAYDPSNCTQEVVWNDLGESVLNACWEGYNATLFAYGQTGAGKSYSMLGKPDDEGIIPRACKQIFKKIQNEPEENTTYEVFATMVELYNEKIYDLFNPTKTSLKVITVENRTEIQGVYKAPCKNYEEIANMLERGTKARSVRATQMNKESSRAHTIFEIILKRSQPNEKNPNKPHVKVNKLTLVDLAGSEKIAKTGVSGDGLTEACAINTSLSALANVIKALGQKQKIKDPVQRKKFYVPYRTSKLTQVLQQGLGGDSKTVMIAALRPDIDNYEESITTLRYASRVKEIKNVAKKVVTEADLLKQLQKEAKEAREYIKKLEAQLAGKVYVSEKEKEQERVIRELQEKLRENQAYLEEREKIENKEKLEQLRQEAERNLSVYDEKMNSNEVPHLLNLNPDPYMSEKALWFIPEGISKCGRMQQDKSVHFIQLNDISVQPHHCTFENINNNQIFVEPVDNFEIYVNGQLVKEKTELKHGDRFHIGLNLFFKIRIPYEAERLRKSGITPPPELDYTGAVREFAEAQGKLDMIPKDKAVLEMEAKLEELREAMKNKEAEKQKEMEETKMKLLSEKKKMEEALKEYEKQKLELQKKGMESSEKLRQLEEMLRKQKEESDRALQEKEEYLRRKEEELKRWMEEQKRKEEEILSRKRQRTLIEEKLLQVIPMVNEANAISKALKKNIEFEVKLVSEIQQGYGQGGDRISIGVNCIDRVNNVSIFWDFEKFSTRLFLMREMLQDFEEQGDEWAGVEIEKDPFYDDVTETAQLIGIATVQLKSMSHRIDNELWTPILNYKGKSEGELHVALLPCDENGDVDNVDIYMDPQESIGQPLYFKLQLKGFRGLPKDKCAKVFVRYKFYLDSDWTITEKCLESKINMNFNFEKFYKYKSVNADFLDYLIKNSIKFEVYGSVPEELVKGKKGKSVVASLREEIAKLQEEKIKMEAEKDDIEIRLNQIERENNNLKEEIERLKKTTQNQTPKNGNYSNEEAKILRKELDRLSIQLKHAEDMKSELKRLKEDVYYAQLLKREIEKLKDLHDNEKLKHLNDIEKNTLTRIKSLNFDKEIEDLKRELHQKEIELREWKRKAQEAEQAAQMKMMQLEREPNNTQKNKKCIIL